MHKDKAATLHADTRSWVVAAYSGEQCSLQQAKHSGVLAEGELSRVRVPGIAMQSSVDNTWHKLLV